jgi:hypothetical protein
LTTKTEFKKQWREHITALTRLGLSDGCTTKQYSDIVKIQALLNEIVYDIAEKDETLT